MAQYKTNGFDQSTHPHFNKISDKLFVRNGIDTLGLYISHHRNVLDGVFVSEKPIVSVDDLQNHLSQVNNCSSQDTFLIIPQGYSWGRVKITNAAFRVLIKSMNVFAQFLDIVIAFGVKSSEDERVVYGCRSCAHQTPCSREQHEICYNILYVEKHGRNLSDPWSLRQMGVYHQLRNSLQTSCWILLNPAGRAKSQVKEFFESRSDRCHLALHAKFLLSMACNWADYIEYLSEELRKHNDKACYSIVDRTQDCSYGVSYVDLQDLHMLQSKIQRAEAAVDSCLDIAIGCQEHFSLHLGPDRYVEGWKESSELLDMYSVDIGRHRKCLQRLNCRLESTLNLLSRILLFRNEELLQHSNRASCNTLTTLLSIADQGQHQQDSLASILRNAQADSDMLKALSVIATVCLPASLIASIFSSNLIQSVVVQPTSAQQKQQEQQSAPRLALSPQFWIYIAITLPLMGLTFAWILYLNRKSRRNVFNKAMVTGNQL